MGQDLNASDVARLEWCILALESVKNLGRNSPLGNRWADVVVVIGTIKNVLKPNLVDTGTSEADEDDPWLSGDDMMGASD